MFKRKNKMPMDPTEKLFYMIAGPFVGLGIIIGIIIAVVVTLGIVLVV